MWRSTQKPDQIQAVLELVKNQQCAGYYLPSGPIAGRCLPGLKEGANGEAITVFDEADTNITVQEHQTVTLQNVFNASTWIHLYAETQEVVKKIVIDYQNSWKVILW